MENIPPPEDYKKQECNGQLEHYDESLKSKKGEEGKKDWLWDNFFMADSDTNTKIKGRKSVEKDMNNNYILKPDDSNYNEFELLEYDNKRHRYRANKNQTKERRVKINRMINEVLGLNYGVLPKERELSIRKHLKYIKFKEYTQNNIPFEAYPTAIKMYIKNNLSKKKYKHLYYFYRSKKKF